MGSRIIEKIIRAACGCGPARERYTPNHKAFGRANSTIMLDRAPIVNNARQTYDQTLIDGNGGGGGCSDPCVPPTLTEWTKNGPFGQFVLSDTPQTGYKWIIDAISAYDDNGAADVMTFFILAPGYTFVIRQVAGVDMPWGINAPGTIKIGIGRVSQGSTIFTDLNTTAQEGTVQHWMPGYELHSQWKIGVANNSSGAAPHTLGLRMLYRQVPDCGSSIKPRNNPGILYLPANPSNFGGGGDSGGNNRKQ